MIPRNILWTGGWDSTFRVLDLVLRLEKEVQPYYLVDRGRASATMEQRAMTRIRELIHARSSQASALIHPLQVFELDSSKGEDNLVGAVERLRRHGFIGLQYSWIARFACEHGVEDLELCVHRDDKAYQFVRPYVCRVRSGDDEWFALTEGVDVDADVRRLFGQFRYPILELTKAEMEAIAKSRGYKDVLEETWFCYSPTRRNEPCGICNPCKYTIEEGLARRVPWRGRIAYRVNRALNVMARPVPKQWRLKALNLIRGT